LTVVEDLGASYVSLQNVNARNAMSFDLLGAPNRSTTWFAAAAGYDSVSRTRDFLSADFSNPSGLIPDLFFDEIAVYNEVVLTVVNDFCRLTRPAGGGFLPSPPRTVPFPRPSVGF
jgi:hypothetical protein